MIAFLCNKCQGFFLLTRGINGKKLGVVTFFSSKVFQPVIKQGHLDVFFVYAIMLNLFFNKIDTCTFMKLAKQIFCQKF